MTGPDWKKGDLFLSLRNVSAVLLYRPSTDQIVWMKRGPWIGQHDVDILDDHRIGIYDNAAENRGEAPLSLSRRRSSYMISPRVKSACRLRRR